MMITVSLNTFARTFFYHLTKLIIKIHKFSILIIHIPIYVFKVVARLLFVLSKPESDKKDNIKYITIKNKKIYYRT